MLSRKPHCFFTNGLLLRLKNTPQQAWEGCNANNQQTAVRLQTFIQMLQAAL
jgi:hypothetical protein